MHSKLANKTLGLDHRVPVLPLSLTGCVTLDKLFNLFVPQ